nr:immunoglobulin heavy chain junction region [Macaca mulatta]
CAKGPYFEFW